MNSSKGVIFPLTARGTMESGCEINSSKESIFPVSARGTIGIGSWLNRSQDTVFSIDFPLCVDDWSRIGKLHIIKSIEYREKTGA